MSSKTKSKDGSPSCWICLCDEPDDDGKLPVRDCSCRGDSAGYAHLSCLVKYAQTKSTEISNKSPAIGNVEDFFKAWKKCPNCEQAYQHQLAFELANSLLLFVKSKHSKYTKEKYLLVAAALQVKMEAAKANMGIHGQLAQGIEAGNELVALFKDMVVKLPNSKFNQKERDLLANAYGQLSTLYLLDSSNEGKKKAIVCCEKSLDIYKSIGNREGVKTMEDLIKYIKSNSFAQDGLGDQLNTLRQILNDEIKMGNSGGAVGTATALARSLLLTDHGIESERILTKYAPISRRVHGEDHSQTKEIELVLTKCKARLVALENGEEFQALRYEGGGDKCVVKGPVRKDYHIRPVVEVEGATEYTVDSSSLLITNGTPIVCQGLQKGAHLNGKLADVRSFDKDKERYTIRFEDKSLKPVAVKKENVRIVFDLPDVE